FANVKVHRDFAEFQQWQEDRPLFACTTKAKQYHHQADFVTESILLFGPESRGLPTSILDALNDKQKIRIPMCTDSRSLNLSNATAIILYEAWRQLGYSGAV